MFLPTRYLELSYQNQPFYVQTSKVGNWEMRCVRMEEEKTTNNQNSNKKEGVHILCVQHDLSIYNITYTGSSIGGKGVLSFIGIDVKSNIAGIGLSGGV